MDKPRIDEYEILSLGPAAGGLRVWMLDTKGERWAVPVVSTAIVKHTFGYGDDDVETVPTLIVYCPEYENVTTLEQFKNNYEPHGKGNWGAVVVDISTANPTEDIYNFAAARMPRKENA